MVRLNKIVLLIICVSMLVLSLQNSCVWANFKPAPFPAVRILSSGEVSPSSALISRNGNIYTFTGNWTTCVLEVERSNIVIDGAGFFIVGNGVGQGIVFHDVDNVSVLNVNIVDVNSGIYIEKCSDTTVSSCSIMGGNNGIYLNNSKNSKITNNHLFSVYNGLFLDHSNNNILRNNSIENSHQYGYGLDFMVTGITLADYTNDVDASNHVNGGSIIYWVNRQNEIVPSDASYVALINCKGITVQNLHISKTQGILVAWTKNSTIAHNYLDKNHIGIQVLYSSEIVINENEIWHNTGFEEGGDGINIAFSQFITVSNNKLTDNHNGGVTCSNSSRNLLIGNRIGLNNYNGINLVNNSDFNLVTLNKFFNHSTMSRGAVLIEDSRNNTLVANDFTHNGCWAIQLRGTQANNLIYLNNFINNSYYNTRSNSQALQVSTPGTTNGNSWDNGLIGNYWSDYKGVDTNNDGTGDTPYYINPTNQDNYPLTSPVTTSQTAKLTSELTTAVFSSQPPFKQLSLIAIAVSFAALIVGGTLVYLKKRKR
ncbi:MAG: right-handed parallel beta-helix repeat-containing protein [Candidatus Bathyarchaeia archaeon]